jgi:hypothetical protein
MLSRARRPLTPDLTSVGSIRRMEIAAESREKRTTIDRSAGTFVKDPRRRAAGLLIAVRYPSSITVTGRFGHTPRPQRGTTVLRPSIDRAALEPPE